MIMMMMNCFCGIVDRRKALSLISSRDHHRDHHFHHPKSLTRREQDLNLRRTWLCWRKLCSSDDHSNHYYSGNGSMNYVFGSWGHVASKFFAVLSYYLPEQYSSSFRFTTWNSVWAWYVQHKSVFREPRQFSKMEHFAKIVNGF